MSLLVDIGYSSLKARLGDRGLEIALQRAPGGELTPASLETAARELGRFLAGGRFSRRASCAIPARGVSLRRLVLPPASRDETTRLVSLQLEKEFPLPPADLAFGYSVHGEGNGTGGTGPGQEVVLAALRKESLDAYRKLLERCGLRPSFSLGVLASSALCPSHAGRSLVLDIGRTHTQLLSLENGKPQSVRSLPWGGEAVTEAIGRALGISREEAEAVKLGLRGSEGGGGEPAGHEHDPRARAAIRESLGHFLQLLGEARQHAFQANGSAPPRLFLAGRGSLLAGLREEVSRALGQDALCERLEEAAVPGRSAATSGLERQAALARNGSLLLLAPRTARESRLSHAQPRAWGWLAAALVLLAVSISFRYARPFLGSKALEARLQSMASDLHSRPAVDRELGFLEHLEASQPPYLEVLAAIAAAASPGTLVDSFSMSQRGEVTLHGTTGSMKDANDLRGKLSLSGWFSQVALEEGSPAKDQKRAEFRLRGQLRSGASPASRPSPPADAAGGPGAKTEVPPEGLEKGREKAAPPPPAPAGHVSPPSGTEPRAVPR